MAADSHSAPVPFRVPAPADYLVTVLAALDTVTLEALAAAAIELLDQRAGDCDVEEDDPSGDALDERGEHPSDDGCTVLTILPVYGDDQTAGPVNGRAAFEAHLAADEALHGPDIAWAAAA
ncbi:hypothetical protein [Sphingomonas aquatilis]